MKPQVDLLPRDLAAATHSCVSTDHEMRYSTMRFDDCIWKFLHPKQIVQRVEAWRNLVQGPVFRIPDRVEWNDHHVQLHLPPLPPSFCSILDTDCSTLTVQEQDMVLLRVSDALVELHRKGFHMGILFPQLVYVNRTTLDIILDVQPFPTSVPFVNQMLGPDPFILYGRFSRAMYMPRTADFYAFGILMYWTIEGRFPSASELQDGIQCRRHAGLTDRLLNRPESFLLMDEVSAALRTGLGLPAKALEKMDSWSPREWLHPACPAMTEQHENSFQRFLRGEGHPIVAVLSHDESTRVDVIRQNFNQVLEHDFIINIRCRDFPFATLRETIDRLLFNARLYRPESLHQIRHLIRKLEKLLRMHYHGDDVFVALAEWFYLFAREILPAFNFQKIYFAFDAVQEFDEDSQRVIQHFWRKYHDEVVPVRVLFTGTSMPRLFEQSAICQLEIEDLHKDVYKRIIHSQLAGSSAPLISSLAEWAANVRIPYTYMPMALESLLEDGILMPESSGWELKSPLPHVYRPETLLEARIRELPAIDFKLLQVWSCLPSPIRARSMYLANHLDTAELYDRLCELHQLGLIRAYHDDSVFVPVEVVRLVQKLSSADNMKTACLEALLLQRTYRPNAIPPLIALAGLAGDVKSQYFYTIRYYREVRSVLSYERAKIQLQTLRTLQQSLGRTDVLCWDRLLAETYHKLNQIQDAERLAAALYQRTGSIKDRLRWLMMTMYLNRLNIADTQEELMSFIKDTFNPLRDRVRAAGFLTRSDFFRPLKRDGANQIHHFYRNHVHPNVSEISFRLYSEFTISYTILTFLYFPERESAALVLLDMLESALSDSPHRDMMSLLYDAYVFQSNIRISRTYTQKLLELSKRTGSTSKEQVCHLNGMELSLLQGDVASYRNHKERCAATDEIKRADLREQFVLHEMIYSCEWEQWDEFERLEVNWKNVKLNASTIKLWDVYQRYTAFRQKLPMPERPAHQEEDHLTLFVDALYALTEGRVDEAIRLFQDSIADNGYHLTAGWSYREILSLLSSRHSPDFEPWLARFEGYLKTYELDVFWPDYDRLAGELCIDREDHQQAILHLRRAINGYQLIEKPAWKASVEAQLEALIEPQYVPENSVVRTDPAGLQLMAERTEFLNQSLDLMIIIQLCERVTESLDLDMTCERLCEALFQYFPVTRADITLSLYRRQGVLRYAASGLISTADARETVSDDTEKHPFQLYHQGGQSLLLEVFVQDLSETKRRHMAHFLSVVRPHIANSIHYQEMMIDNLTGFYQRRYFVERLEQEFHLSRKHGLDLSLIMLDLDNFRSINNFGHPEGDKVLRELSEIVRSVLRTHDIPGRYGGEEILLILPKTDGKSAVRLAERLRAEIEEEFTHGRPYQLTVSAGVSSLQLNGSQTADELISAADEAEIQAKATGKNRVVASWLPAH